MKILMVCLGNICRSPLADGLLRHKVKKLNLDITVDSAGTANYHTGKAPDHRMIATAKKNGVDLSFLRARQFQTEDFDHFDVIYVMDQSNLANVLKKIRNQQDEGKVKMILNELQAEQNLEVPDPYYGEQKDFDEVFELLDKTTDRLIEIYK